MNKNSQSIRKSTVVLITVGFLWLFVTTARGHSGDNAGKSAIVSMLTKGEASRNQTLVFGCPLFGADQEGVSLAAKRSKRA